MNKTLPRDAVQRSGVAASEVRQLKGSGSSALERTGDGNEATGVRSTDAG